MKVIVLTKSKHVRSNSQTFCRTQKLLVSDVKLMLNNTDTEAPFLDLHLSIANGFVSSKIYDKCNDFDFDIVYSVFGW